MAKQYVIDTEKVFTSKNYGDFKIVEEVERDKYKNRNVKIRFIETGYECITALSSVLKGAVKDPTYIPQKHFVHPKHGPYTILDKYNKDGNTKNLYCHVYFERTDNILEFLYGNALKGEIKNPYDRTIYGIACIGVPKRQFDDRMYNTWYNMLTRCYNPKYERYACYGGSGVVVCERWKIFEYFLEDAYQLPNGEHAFEDGWELDKDILQPNFIVKIYSPDTCMWVPRYVNKAITVETKRKTKQVKNKYYGVKQNKSNTYSVRVIDNNRVTKYYGTYNDPIAAANVYNLEAMNIGNKMLNQVPYIGAYNILMAKHGEPYPNPNLCDIVNQPHKDMCEIIDSTKPKSMCYIIN